MRRGPQGRGTEGRLRLPKCRRRAHHGPEYWRVQVFGPAHLGRPVQARVHGTQSGRQEDPGECAERVPLTRLAPGDASAIKKNRGRSTRTCTRVFGANYAQYDPATNTHLYDCDEYPFASTQQGAQIPRGNTNFSVRALPEADNQAGGRVLGDFYRTQRIIKDDRFYVTITGPAIPPAPGAPAPLPGMETWGRCEQFDTPSGGEADVCGPILDKYKERGGPASLGLPAGQ